ncbi:MAG: hypothetical protein ACKOTB_00655, partial [Planctomycetia bacterium]
MRSLLALRPCAGIVESPAVHAGSTTGKGGVFSFRNSLSALIAVAAFGFGGVVSPGSHAWAADDAPAAAATEAAAGSATATTPAAAEPAPAAAEPAAADAAAPAAPTMTTEAMIKNLWLAADTVWVLVCGMLVFFMNLGFGCVESGFARAKNCVNILSKNFVVFAATAIGFWLIGWDLMFGADSGGWIGNSGSWMVGGADGSPAIGDAYKGVYPAISWASVPLWAKFFFQLVFAGTAA